MLCCDAAVVPIVMDGKGQPLDVGRITRTIPDGLRRAVAARDRGCAHPGCGRPGILDRDAITFFRGNRAARRNCEPGPSVKEFITGRSIPADGPSGSATDCPSSSRRNGSTTNNAPDDEHFPISSECEKARPNSIAAASGGGRCMSTARRAGTRLIGQSKLPGRSRGRRYARRSRWPMSAVAMAWHVFSSGRRAGQARRPGVVPRPPPPPAQRGSRRGEAALCGVSSSCSRRWPRPPSRPSGWSTVCPFTCLPTTGCGGMPRCGTSPSSGEAASQLPDESKARFPEAPWQQPARLRNRIVHGYWLVDLTFCTRRHSPACRASRQRCIVSWRF